MSTFAEAVQKADETGMPVVEGFALRLEAGTGTAVTAWLEARHPESGWMAGEMAEGWWVVRATAALPELGAAWESVRDLPKLPGVRSAEPLLLARLPVTNGSEAQRVFQLWGQVSAERRSQIKAASSLHWPLEQMGLCDVNGRKGAWAIWKEKRGNKTRIPGEGILVAGHGTGIAQGVAPGAKVLPLQMSSSVVHPSLLGLCDAFVEAMDRGAQVLSISLGGPLGSELLQALVRRALDRGILVVAAAGDYAPTVTFPARLPGVIACAAGNALKGPWRFSGMGSEVAITAPGELVGGPAGGSGTSFAAAHVAGLAALWLSFHGQDKLLKKHCGDRPELLPFLFRLCLQKSADRTPTFPRSGKGGFGAGIARADRLLTAKLADLAEVERERQRVLAQAPSRGVGFPESSWWTIVTLPALAEGEARIPAPAECGAREQRILDLLSRVAGPGCDGRDHAEIGALSAVDPALQSALEQAGRGARNCVSATALRRHLLRSATPLSATLQEKLAQAREADQAEWIRKHPELAAAYALPTAEDEEKKTAYAIAPPPTRRLRAFAFDPSLATSSSAAAVNEVTIPVVFERTLEPGPVGDYLEVVDVDPASGCAYAPVDLNHPFLLAQDGLPRSEGNPQFHQQMVYAVAMKTIGHFEEALGRPIFWSPLRPWDWRSGDDDRVTKPGEQESEDLSNQFIRRLRLYPHALRDQNAYYSPQKRAILFGYFPAGDGDPGAEYPGGVVFTCLAHDIIAHEMTHAILDGMHVHFIESTNPDVYAFHEAFADIVALFQRFAYPELLRDQIARVRGRLDSGTLMTRLALQFGGATGRRQALRDALGHVVEQARRKGELEWRDLRAEREMDGGGAPQPTLADTARDLSDEETRRLWKRYRADPWLLAEVEEPHERGSILVAAVFDAYLRIYEDRVVDLKRIATGGTGVLPDGDLHPDLVRRMADEAAKSAHHVLRMCLRAMDYVPPLDITFGEFLRALITADSDLVPDDDRRYRVAFIEAFRKWGIYPRDVRTLSQESLRWSPPAGRKIYLFPELEHAAPELREEKLQTVAKVRRALLEWRPGEPRKDIFEKIKAAQGELWQYFRNQILDRSTQDILLGGIDPRRSFQVTNLRPARRIGPRGEFLTEMVVEIIQNRNALPYDVEERREELARRRKERQARLKRGEMEIAHRLPFRGGVTLIVSLDDYSVRYAIHKRIDSAAREDRQRAFRAAGGGSEAAEYSSDGLPAGWLTNADLKAAWLQGRTSNMDDMRASSCACRRTRMEVARKADIANEPFALLHRS
jgi:hypothetical protein